MATAAAADGRKIEIGRVLQRTFGSIGRNFPSFIGLSILLVGLPTFLMQYLTLTWGAQDASTLSPLVFLSFPVAMVIGYLLQATIIRATIEDLSQRSVKIGEGIGLALRLLLPILGVAILSSVLIGLGFLLLVVPGIIAYVMLMVAIPVLIEEKRGVIGSMKRSRELTRGSRWQIFFLLILLAIVYIVVSSLAGAAGFAFASSDSPVALAALQATSATLIGLFGAALAACVYVELRTVKEGATEDDLARIFE